MRRKPSLIVFTTVLLVAGAGCGTSGTKASDPTSSSTAGTSTTRATATTTGDQTTTTTDLGPSTTTSGSSPDEPVCDPLKKISDLDQKFKSEVTGATDWNAVKAKVIDFSNQLVDAYDRAVPVAPKDLAGDLEKVRQFTESSIDVVRASSSLDEFGSKEAADPKVQTAGAAAVRIDTFAKATCGFSTGGN